MFINSANSTGGGLILGTLLHSFTSSNCVFNFCFNLCSSANSSSHTGPIDFLNLKPNVWFCDSVRCGSDTYVREDQSVQKGSSEHDHESIWRSMLVFWIIFVLFRSTCHISVYFLYTLDCGLRSGTVEKISNRFSGL